MIYSSYGITELQSKSDIIEITRQNDKDKSCWTKATSQTGQLSQNEQGY